MTIKENISQAIVEHIQKRYAIDMVYGNQILNAVKDLLQSDGYNFQEEMIVNNLITDNARDSFQDELAKINEKESRRKKDGVYYTDKDVTDYMAANVLLHYVSSDQKKVWSIEVALKKIMSLPTEKKTSILYSSVLDPTCGTGEFLLSTLEVKLKLMSSCPSFSAIDLTRSIYGNDIEEQSTEITKIRVFFLIVDSIPYKLDLVTIVSVLNANFTNHDAILYDRCSFGKKDIIIGNPPYIEYRNFSHTSNFEYGNVYADVLHYSVDILSENGIMAFVVPLSFVSTIRMAKIREYISRTTNKQIVLNFADRPDSLFSCVHQKLTILIAQRNAEFSGTLSSSYNYWYQSERSEVFERIDLMLTYTDSIAYWPKLGNRIESEIYSKFKSMQGNNLLDYDSRDSGSKIYLNQRGCFWMKAFTKDMNSNSYTCYNLPSEIASFAYCAINSSLFFLLWIIVSDGWHITNKELALLKFPNKIEDKNIWEDLAKELENKLEETKVYVGTKQVDYEYKHKFCKNIIDRIDDQLASVYNLSDSQLRYIKEFALKYRISDGTNA